MKRTLTNLIKIKKAVNYCQPFFDARKQEYEKVCFENLSSIFNLQLTKYTCNFNDCNNPGKRCHSEHLPFGLSTEVGKAGSEDRHKNLDF